MAFHAFKLVFQNELMGPLKMLETGAVRPDQLFQPVSFQAGSIIDRLPWRSSGPFSRRG